MSNSNSRKRAAPGASPMLAMPQPLQQPYTTNNGVGDQVVKWNGTGDNVGHFLDGVDNSTNAYELIANQPQYPQNVRMPSDALTRRPMNTALVPTASPWPNYVDDDTSLIPREQDEQTSEQETIEKLEELAQNAKRESQSKRKQIPPFVQKLSSFLEEGKNEELIRWSEKGDSFIVLDEDEFAKTLIPELFKHNNYASFVRQLNMYGFHKRVGLSDNSMRASERKNKSPSEYSNPYFRRGHPNLLWLINKPKTKGKGKGKAHDGDGESDDEVGNEDGHAQASGSAHVTPGRALPPTENQAVQKKELSLIRGELGKVQEQQKLILKTINRLQQNNNDLYNQAMLFQNQHSRHQNSINAILHFLANLFRKSLEEQGSNQNVSDIISSLISNQGQQSTAQPNVVELGDFLQNPVDTSTPLSGHKRARGLLPPIPNQEDSTRSTRSPSTGRSTYYPMGQNHQTGQVTELFDGSPADTPQSLRQELENNPHEQMLKIINDHNANNSSGIKLPETSPMAGNSPDNIHQDRRFPTSQSPPSFPGGNGSGNVAGIGRAATNAPTNMGTGQMTPKSKPVSPPPTADNTAVPSLSPIMRSPAMPPLSIHQIGSNQTELEQIHRLQSEQGAKIDELNELLGPLSPSGHIPSVDDQPDTYFDSNNVDLAQFLNLNDNSFLEDGTFGGNGFDMNFDGTGDSNNFDPGQLGVPDGVANTPSPTGTEEITREDFGLTVDNDRGAKRQRMQ